MLSPDVRRSPLLAFQSSSQFSKVADATSIAYAAEWDSILTLGQGSVGQMEDVWAQTEASQLAS